MPRKKSVPHSTSQPTADKSTSHHNSIPAWMWRVVTDRAAPIPIRESVLVRLAREKTPGVIELCDLLYSSDYFDEWIMGIIGLRELGTKEAIEHLFELCETCDDERREDILIELARAVTKDYVENFKSLLARHFHNGIVDSTGWTPWAVSALEEIKEQEDIIDLSCDIGDEPNDDSSYGYFSYYDEFPGL